MTRSEDDRPASGEAKDRFYIVSAGELDRLVISLTVVHGYVQLLRRRVLRNPTSNREDLSRALDHIELATRSMSADLWEVMGATSRSREGPESSEPDANGG